MCVFCQKKLSEFQTGKKLQPYENDSKHRAAVENEVRDSITGVQVYRIILY